MWVLHKWQSSSFFSWPILFKYFIGMTDHSNNTSYLFWNVWSLFTSLQFWPSFPLQTMHHYKHCYGVWSSVLLFCFIFLSNTYLWGKKVVLNKMQLFYHKVLLKVFDDVESGLAGVRPKILSTSLQCWCGPGSGVYVKIRPVEYMTPSQRTNDTGTCNKQCFVTKIWGH